MDRRDDIRSGARTRRSRCTRPRKAGGSTWSASASAPPSDWSHNMRMTRREWIAAMTSAPLLHGAPEAPAAPVAIAKCATYEEDVTAKMGAMFDQLGGLEKLVRNKTVTIKVNMTGPPGQRFQSEEHTSELQSLRHLVCRLLLEK